ncbi:MAG: anthranilate phosphoribosyltransferase [Gemmatimonadaceae bacterium]
MADAILSAIRRLAARESLDSATITKAFAEIMRGEGTSAQVAALLMALRVKGETPSEVAGVVRAMRDAMHVLPASEPQLLVDTCGTGGGSLTTFNISTAAALLAAGAGVRIAKHGNRSFTSRSGSADVLEALGVAIEVTPEVMLNTLNEAGIVFMFAPLMHPAMRHVGPVRRELTIGTVMNIVGPLANPARAGRQVVGVAERGRQELIAGALAELGTEHAMVVYGEPGLDEVSPLGPTTVVEIRGGDITRWEIDPAMAGEDGIRAEDLAGGGPEENAAVIERVLGGGGAPAARAAVVLNAAAAIYVAGMVATYEAAVGVARETLRAGRGVEALARLRRASPRIAG